ncbi:MAG TPA: pyridoxamine 5'-phosphate oxidase family protein [Acidimicrobiales bacterium]|nr:pyridoxamine 5'-phosphate oxidase family protein [Acidimicrobiales bacterium]
MDLSEDIEHVKAMVGKDNGLASISTTRADGSVQASLVNAGVLDHPIDGSRVAAFVAAGNALKLRHLRARPELTIMWRAGWEWIAVEGESTLVGPDDPLEGIDAEGLRLLLRAVFQAAGGRHDDFDEYDRVMAAERRTVVLVRPYRIYGNPR